MREELKIICKNNEIKWIDMAGGYGLFRGQLSGIVSFINITDRKNHVETLQNLKTELKKRVTEQTTELEKTNIKLKKEKTIADITVGAKSTFWANMSHEIRPPINSIIAAVDLALNEDKTPEMSNFLKTIQSSSYSLSGGINNILDFTKKTIQAANSAQYQPNKDAVINLEASLNKTLTSIRSLAKYSGKKTVPKTDNKFLTLGELLQK